MASLGNIWFDLNLKDNTGKDLDKIIKELSKKDVEIGVDINKDKLANALKGIASESSKSSGNMNELAKALDISNKQAQDLVANMKEANANEISILNNTERLKKAKERLLELERSVVLRGIDQTEAGKDILKWTKEAAQALESVDITDKTEVIRAAGAELSAQINIRKDLMRHTTKSISDEIKGNRDIENSNLSVEKALLRIQKIRDRIANDPYREQEGYRGVNAEIDKIASKLEQLKGKGRVETRGYLSVGINKDIQAVENLIKEQDRLYRKTTEQTSHMGRLWGQMGNQIKGIVSIYAVQRFTRQLIEMGGEFEKQHYALRAIIGDLGRADQIFNNLKKVAVKSPFHFGDFTGYAKQLAAFSIPINEIYDTTKRLADVSAGLGVDMSRIILAYGQIRSASFLRGQEVRQLTEAGIPIIEELSKKLTELRGQVVSTGEVFDAISRREVPFEMVKEVFKEMTDEGGKFYNMQEILAESLSGKWANLTSHYQIMLYDVAQSNRGMLHGLIEALTSLVKNFRATEAAISGLITAYVAFNTVTKFTKLKEHGNMWANLGKQILGATENGLNYANVIAAGFGIVVSAWTYISNKTKDYNATIEKIIISTFEVTEKFTSQVHALIDLADATKDNTDALVERERILNEIAETEPDVVDTLREHADNTKRLREELEHYIIVKKAARDIELGFQGDSWLSDTMEDTEGKVDKAMSALDKFNIKSRQSVADLLTEMDSRSLGDILISRGDFKNWGEDILQELEAVLTNVNKKAEERWIEFNRIAYNYIKERSGAGFASAYLSPVATYDRIIEELENKTASFDNRILAASEVLKNSLKFEIDTRGIKEGSEEYNKIIYAAINTIEGASDRIREAMFKVFEIDKSKFDKETNKLEGWRKEVKDIVGNIITITNTDSIEDVMSGISTEIDNIKKSLDGVDIKKLEVLVSGGNASDAQAEVVKNYNFKLDSLKLLEKAKKVLGIVDTKGGSGGRTKDPFADKMEKRVKLIEDANSAYEKYIPLLGRVKALEKVREDDRYKKLDFKPDSVESMLRDVYKQLGNTEAQQKVKDSIEKTLSSIDFDKVKKGVDALSKDIEKYISSNKERWGLFDKLFEQTGDFKLSFTLAFGTETDEDVKNYTDALTKKLQQMLGEGVDIEEILAMDVDDLTNMYGDPMIKLIDKVKEARLKATEDILLSDAKAIAATANLEEKANKIREQYNKKIESTDNEKAKVAYTKQMNDELSDLYSTAIQLTPVWQKIFGNVSDMSYKTLKKLVKETEKLLETATELKGDDGKPIGVFEMIDKDGNNLRVGSEAYTRFMKQVSKMKDDLGDRNPFAALVNSWIDFVNAPDGDKADKLAKLASTAANAADEVAKIADAFGSMFDAFGNESMSEAMGLAGDITSELGGIAAGFAAGGPAGAGIAALSSVPNIIGAIAGHHDRKLDRRIRKSAEEVNRLKNAYEEVERTVRRQLGSMTKDQTEKQIESLKGQVANYESMIKNERKKKKSDQSKIDDYRKQIDILNDEILFFYEDLANSLYDIDLKGWASQFSTAIMDAWRRGGDAAKAYEETANEVLANVANKMVAQAILEPVFKKLREALPDMLDDGKVDKEEMGQIAGLLVEVGDKWTDATTMYEEINDMIKEMSDGRFDLKFDDEMESNLGKGIQSLTEDTAQLLASYLNAIRQDVSVKRELLAKITDVLDVGIVGNISTLVADIKKIEANTARNANGVDSINDKLDSVMNGTKTIYTS